MDNAKIYRWAGICALATQAIFFIEFPFYLVRGDWPGITDPRIAEYTARNGTNSMVCVFLDFLILGLLMVFAAGLRHLIRQADPHYEWLGTLFFGISIAFVALTLVADTLQAATVLDARTDPANALIIRGMWESAYLMYGSVALFLIAFFIAVASYATVACRALPKWSGRVGYLCALACLVFVPSMFVGHPDPTRFYNPAGWGPGAIAACFPLAAWMIVVGILMIRKGRAEAS